LGESTAARRGRSLIHPRLVLILATRCRPPPDQGSDGPQGTGQGATGSI